ncbi:hypothetical protein L9H26_09685 [Morganella psychrotolerans]|uniref:Uncharacterized protein n=1 Tax=Morganella psychrotolerans TaxID=368603 RepID=A0A5M9R6Y2_9GAMM|nr:hypothetical protein [Morganella psychrotolerans]KAA8716440.1 hypothetical protein F4V73_00675 [Morganella psychrotolerans]OBU09163.1 hypothetical protein AYY16_08350 [Morganella psychrotolerans]
MQNILFSLHQAVKDSPEGDGDSTEAFARALAEQTFWVESQGSESGGQVGLAFSQGDDDKEPRLFAYMRDDGSDDAPADIEKEMASGERDYTWLPGAFLLGLSGKIDYTLCVIGGDGQSLSLDSRFVKMLFLYMQALYQEEDEPAAAPVNTVKTIAQPAGNISDIVAKPKSGAGKVIGMLLVAAVIIAVVYFTQS